MLERAREVLAAGGSVPTDTVIVTKALGDLLTKRDPLRKAERAASAQRRRDSASAEKCGTSAATTNESQECSAPAQQPDTTIAPHAPAAPAQQQSSLHTCSCEAPGFLRCAMK